MPEVSTRDINHLKKILFSLLSLGIRTELVVSLIYVIKKTSSHPLVRVA